MRPYAGESRDEWEGVTCPEDVIVRPRAVDEDEAYERLRQREMDDEQELAAEHSDEHLFI